MWRKLVRRSRQNAAAETFSFTSAASRTLKIAMVVIDRACRNLEDEE